MKLLIRVYIFILLTIVLLYMVVSQMCYRYTESNWEPSCFTVRSSMRSEPTTQDPVPLKNNHTVFPYIEKQQYKFSRILEMEKQEHFERRKEEMLFKLDRRKARVFDKTIDIDEPFPLIADEKLKVKKYFNISSSKLTLLNSNFIIYNKNLCLEDIGLIVLVPSIPGNFNIRKAVRETYGSIAQYTTDELVHAGIDEPIKLAFLLGRSPNQTVQTNIKAENKRYGDIIQADFVDSYFNLTLKMLYGFKWINAFCKSIKFVLKADEDVFVNLPLLIKELKTYKISKKGSVFGFIHTNLLALRVLRAGKWGVSKEEYPLRRYPPYAQGTSYTLTYDLIPRIIEVAEHMPYLHIEDAFITGIIAGKLLGASLEIMLGNSYWTDETPSPCEFVKTERVSQTNMSPALMANTWQTLKKPGILCANSTYRARVHRHTIA